MRLKLRILVFNSFAGMMMWWSFKMVVPLIFEGYGRVWCDLEIWKIGLLVDVISQPGSPCLRETRRCVWPSSDRTLKLRLVTISIRSTYWILHCTVCSIKCNKKISVKWMSQLVTWVLISGNSFYILYLTQKL